MPPTPTSTFHSPGPFSTFIPTAGDLQGATGMMQVEFSRNPASFALNRYAEIRPGVPEAGYYAELNTADATRVVALDEYAWPDGSDAPQIGDRKLKWNSYQTNRNAFPFRLGQRAINNARGWDIIGGNARMSAQQAMTARTLKALAVINTAANWPAASKAATGTIAGGGAWDESTTSNMYIKVGIHHAVEAILKNTGGAVRPSQILMLIGPDFAHALSETAEIIQYLVNHERAMTDALGEQGLLSNYGLPRYLYGIEVVVEDAVRTTSRAGVTDVSTFMMGNNATFVSRPGGLIGPASDAPTFSTVTGFISEDMTVEAFTDNENRRYKGRVTDNTDFVLTAAASGYHIADISA